MAKAQSDQPGAPHRKVLPVSIRMETLGGLATPLVLRGTPLPTERVETFSTAEDNQGTVEIKILMGERPLAAKSIVVGSIQLSGIPPAPAGRAQIRVALTVAPDYSISASASVQGTELETTGQISPDPKYLRVAMLAKILADAEAHKDEDTEKVGQVEESNRATALIREAEARLAAERKKKVKTLNLNAIERAIAAAGLALDSADRESVRSATHLLEESIRPPEVDMSAFLTASPFAGLFTRPTARSSGSNTSAGEQTRGASRQAGTRRSTGEGTQVSASSAHRLGRVFGGGEFTLDPSLCFVLMPFDPKLQRVYDDHVKPAVVAAGLECQRADEMHGVNAITTDIWERINRARFLIADLTRRNPNVFYEVGLAHAIGKDVILLTQTMEDVPFDLKGLRCLVYEYTPPGMREFDVKLRKTIDAVVQSPSSG